MNDRPFNVLFLCTHNSARLIIAECIVNRVDIGKFTGYSAGSQPRGEIHPQALALLRRLNYQMNDLRSKSWEEFTDPEAPELDFVFTVFDNAAIEVCPVWPGQPMTAHWGVPDPSLVAGGEAEQAYAFANTYRMLNQRIGIFVSLPLRSLDKPTLQKRLDELGRVRKAAPSETA
jgi:protein-tyrosine-phosphatase